MPIDVTTDKKRLIEIMQGAQKGTVALPQFQRNFVWPLDKIQDLLTSLLKGYYVGSFLVLDVDKESQPFAIRPIVGVEMKPDAMKPTWLLLDGQQRLTSLHYALTSPDEPTGNTKHPYRFFIKLDAIGTEDEDLVFCERKDRCQRWDARAQQYTDRILPLTAVPHWSGWKDGYQDWLVDSKQSDAIDTFRHEQRDKWTQAVERNLLERLIPYVELPRVNDTDQDGIAEVCTVFEKINSTGEPLSVYDLLTARLYKYNVDLHALWEAALEGRPLLSEFTEGSSEKYGVLMLRTVALLRRREVKSKTLVNLDPADFDVDWERAANAFEAALQRLRSTSKTGFGVFDSKWQPYTTLLPVLATALDSLKQNRADARAYADVQAWYWGSVFTERYAGSVETKTYRDAMDLINRIADPTAEPACFKQFRDEVLESPSFSFADVWRNSSKFRGIMNLVAIEGARDFLNNDAIEFHELEAHHIFPRAHLRDEEGAQGGQRVNTILNQTLIASPTNRRISRARPSEYLQSVLPDDARESILRSHFITDTAQEAMAADNYDGFLAARNDALVNRIRELLAPARRLEAIASANVGGE
jgi:hypothetical protein